MSHSMSVSSSVLELRSDKLQTNFLPCLAGKSVLGGVRQRIGISLGPMTIGAVMATRPAPPQARAGTPDPPAGRPGQSPQPLYRFRASPSPRFPTVVFVCVSPRAVPPSHWSTGGAFWDSKVLGGHHTALFSRLHEAGRQTLQEGRSMTSSYMSLATMEFKSIR